jgi:apolipoprotein N-acyltransferase
VTITRLCHSVVLAWGWRRAAIALAAGAASALAMAPFNAWPILLVTFPVLVWQIDGAATGRGSAIWIAAVTGWCFGFGYFVAGLYWIGYAFLVDAKTFGWLLPVAVCGLPAYLALFTAAGTAAARLLWVRGPLRILVLALALTAAEWLRGHALTGFPWNLFGYALTQPLVLAQSAALIGAWGLTFVAVAVFASPAVLTDERNDTPHRWRAPALAAFVVLIMAGYGALSLWAHPTQFVDDVRLRIMQPDLPQDTKFNYSAKQQVLDRYIRLSERATGPQSAGVGDATHLIWPESAFPFFLTREPDALARIADMLPQGTVLLTGSVRAPETTAPNARITRAYNSIYAIDHDGSVLAIYDKVHLVPFGEYLPFQTLLEKLGLMQLTKVAGGFIEGDRRRVMSVPGAPGLLPLICYEIVFPGVLPASEPRPGWMLNLTNDAWFGISTGPYQHFHQARIRAIEEGLPLVRAANNGISAVVDPSGRVVGSLPLGTAGVLDARLPQPLPPTVYARFGDGPLALAMVVTLLLAGRRLTRRA